MTGGPRGRADASTSVPARARATTLRTPASWAAGRPTAIVDQSPIWAAISVAAVTSAAVSMARLSR
jgi:hypothetical protein